MSDTSGSSVHDESRDVSRSNSPSPGRAARRTYSLPVDADESGDWPPSPARSTTSSQLSAEAPSFAPRKAASDGGHDSAYNEHRPVPSHDNAKVRLPSGQTGTLTVLQVTDLHWFTSDRDLVGAGVAANVPVRTKDVTFLEHKCNGKSKGTAFINCHSTENMMRLLKWFETHEFQGKKVTANVSPNVNGKPPIPPPTHDKEGGRHSAFPARDETHPTGRAPLPFPPTNAHGGVNFNRVPLHHRQQVQQMQQAGFLNHSGAASKTARPAIPVPFVNQQTYVDVSAKKKAYAAMHPLPNMYATNDPAIVWQQSSADYARTVPSRSLRV